MVDGSLVEQAGVALSHTFLTWQAGVALGLAARVASEFEGWGQTLATTVTATVVVNQLLGPLLFKAAIVAVGEVSTLHV